MRRIRSSIHKLDHRAIDFCDQAHVTRAESVARWLQPASSASSQSSSPTGRLPRAAVRDSKSVFGGAQRRQQAVQEVEPPPTSRRVHESLDQAVHLVELRHARVQETQADPAEVTGVRSPEVAQPRDRGRNRRRGEDVLSSATTAAVCDLPAWLRGGSTPGRSTARVQSAGAPARAATAQVGVDLRESPQIASASDAPNKRDYVAEKSRRAIMRDVTTDAAQSGPETGAQSAPTQALYLRRSEQRPDCRETY